MNFRDEETVLTVYPFPEEAAYLKNHCFTMAVRKHGGEWIDLQPYNVRIDPDYVQNMTPEDEFKDSPMVYFDFEGCVQVKITKVGMPITEALIHPEALSIPVEIMEDGSVVFNLHQSKPVCVSINGDRQDMVYILANPPEKDIPDRNDPNVIFIEPGVTRAVQSGHEVWKGAIRDVSVYYRKATSREISGLAAGRLADGYAYNWPLTDNMKEVNTGADAFVLGHALIRSGEDNIKALYFNGIDDCVTTDLNVDMSSECFTISAWVYRESEKAEAVRTIISGILSVRSDGRPSTSLGDWQYPLYADRSIKNDCWTNIILIKDSERISLYIDGEYAGSGNRTIQAAPHRIQFGANYVTDALSLMDNQTLYIAGGAVLEGTVKAAAAKNITIRGRGIIDLSRSDYRKRMTGIVLTHCKNSSIEGVIVNDSRSMCTHLCECDTVQIRNYKVFSSYGATDGINIKSSRNVCVSDSFIRSNDDGISVYASIVNYIGGSANITLKDSTIISDAGHAIMSGIHGATGEFDEITNLRFENLDIVDSKCQYEEYQGVIGLNVGNDVTIDDAIFKNIRIEDINLNQLFNLRIFLNPIYCTASGKAIRNVKFKNISYTGKYTGKIMKSQLKGESEDRLVENIEFEDIYINGKKCTTFEEADINVDKFARNITLR